MRTERRDGDINPSFPAQRRSTIRDVLRRKRGGASERHAALERRTMGLTSVIVTAASVGVRLELLRRKEDAGSVGTAWRLERRVELTSIIVPCAPA